MPIAFIIYEPLQRAGVNPRSLVPPYKEDKFSKLACLRAYNRTRYKSKEWAFRFGTKYRF